MPKKKDIKLKNAPTQQKFIELCKWDARQVSPEPKIRIIARTSVEGIHRWAACPIKEVSYLRHYHRHVFNIIAKAYANHDNRDIEFIKLGHDIKKYLTEKYYNSTHSCLMLGDLSCEMIASELCHQFNLYECEVNEDGEGGSIVKNL